MKYTLLKVMGKSADYKRYFYNRIRRMKRWGYVYDPSKSIVENLMLFAIHLDHRGEGKLAEKELEKMERILKMREVFHEGRNKK